MGPRPKLNFFHDHVAYQIKADDACSNMVAEILHASRAAKYLNYIKQDFSLKAWF